jgi:flagellar biosynthesis GTPase FlhF
MHRITPFALLCLANEETERRLKLQKQHEEARRLHEQLHENQMRVDEAHRNQLEQQRVEEQRRAEAQARENQLEQQRRAEAQARENQLEQQRRAEAQARENQLEQQRIEEQRRLGQSIQSPSRNEIESVCKLGVDAGTCGDYQDAYYFDYFTRQCYPFIYSGCGGNKNRFDSLAKCEQYCHILVNQPLGNCSSALTFSNLSRLTNF